MGIHAAFQDFLKKTLTAGAINATEANNGGWMPAVQGGTFALEDLLTSEPVRIGRAVLIDPAVIILRKDAGTADEDQPFEGLLTDDVEQVLEASDIGLMITLFVVAGWRQAIDDDVQVFRKLAGHGFRAGQICPDPGHSLRDSIRVAAQPVYVSGAQQNRGNVTSELAAARHQNLCLLLVISHCHRQFQSLSFG